MKSTTLNSYPRWMAKATPEQISLVDEIYAACEQHYEEGGDTIVECLEPTEVLEYFESVEDAKKYCNLHTQRAKDARWGEDSDAELKRSEWK